MREILLVGGGGHCLSCIDVLEATGEFQIVGIVEPLFQRGKTVLGYPVIGGDNDLPTLLRETLAAVVAVGQIRSATTRKRLFARLNSFGASLPTIVSPCARVSQWSSLGLGTVVMHNAVVNACAEIGANVILNSLSLVEHSAWIGDHCHISTGAIVNGDCVVESECFIGSGAVLREGITVGSGSVIGAGSVVTKNVPPGSFVRQVRRDAISGDLPRSVDHQEETTL